MILQDDVVRLEPFEIKDNIDVVVDLAMKYRYTRLSREDAVKALTRFETIAWKSFDKTSNVFIGIVYLTNAEGRWTLDAYKNDELTDNAMDYSFRIGKLASDYAFTFTDELFTCHAFENRASTIVCKKLGFTEDFIILKRVK